MTVGSELRAAREQRGMSLADVARETRVRASLLSAIEGDDFSALGGAVYARGHIRHFAATVGLDPQPLIEQYDREHESVPVPVLADALPTSFDGVRERSRPNWLAVGVGAAAVLTVALGISFFAGSKSPSTLQAGGNPTPKPSASASTSAPAGSRASARPVPSSSPLVAQLPPVVVRVRITKATSWVQETDDKGSYGTTLTAGTTKIFTAQKQVKLTLGNAGAVDLTVNGKHLGTPGTDGEVLNVAYGPNGTTANG